MSEKKREGKGKKGKGNKEQNKEKPGGDKPKPKGPKRRTAPKLKKLESKDVFEGKNLSLTCEASGGHPRPEFRWYKDEKAIQAENSDDITIKKYKKSSVLEVKKVKASHAGDYKCEAYNKLGNTSSVAQVVVRTATSTAPTTGTGHDKKCRDEEKSFCVNGGECFVIDSITSARKYMCRCPTEFTGDRCQNYVMYRFYKHLGIEFMEAEELYQKRVLTITGICIALLVVGIMCVVAYCKTKKQRKKLHDRLRQGLRPERNNLANGPHLPNPPPENVQLVNYISKTTIAAEHVIERETETSFSTSHYTSTTQHSTTVTQSPCHSWSNGPSESLVSESHSALMSSVENNQHVTPSHYRVRLNGIGGPRQFSYTSSTRATPESYKDSPHSERYMSAMTTPARLSPVEYENPLSPKSPPSEMSPPVSSLTVSVPSVAISPFIEEERPLILVTPPRLREKRHDQNQHHHAFHHNAAHETNSLPSSPTRIVEDEEYETTQEYEPAPEPTKKVVTSSQKVKRTKPNGHIVHRPENNNNSCSVSNSSESETEDERIGEDTPFLSIQNPVIVNLEAATTYRLTESRTNPTSRFSTPEELQARVSSVVINQDPIAV
ncbi:pro-neuregulin-1, membrane-bound isoform isoform X3 [Protopterus annectens]|uniref:pro-neuregulin-1, membrane-bound isoform isoform X3 n=1 Tax=Protopterus annectens TaxID=7888 RepID=UPI001CFADACB|nr:pro-neuregulin-1, membrane-bound isoform isoform X3 [Protopterus annectens]